LATACWACCQLEVQVEPRKVAQSEPESDGQPRLRDGTAATDIKKPVCPLASSAQVRTWPAPVRELRNGCGAGPVHGTGKSLSSSVSVF
jgi:hypothetical protein